MNKFDYLELVLRFLALIGLITANVTLWMKSGDLVFDIVFGLLSVVATFFNTKRTVELLKKGI